MKALVTILVIAIIAGGVIIYQIRRAEETKFELQIPAGQRIPVTDYKTFESLLVKIDSSGQKININVKPEASKPDEEQGPINGGFEAVPPDKRLGPDGSVHVTQRVTAASMNEEDFEKLLAMLQVSPGGAKTPAPTATPAP